MDLKDLDYQYPEHLIATEPNSACRILFSDPNEPDKFHELHKQQLLERFSPGDLLVINDTQVLKKKIFSLDNNRPKDFLFLQPLQSDNLLWSVLFAARDSQPGDTFDLPDGLQVQLVEKGLPQVVRLNRPLTDEYLEKYAELALPPYILQSRQEKHSREQDNIWYQSDWAAIKGSSAAPTASLHFKNEDLEFLKSRGVQISKITLHVGLGTFLPIKAKKLADHVMHREFVNIPKETTDKLALARKQGQKVWALGTTVARALESMPFEYYQKNSHGDLFGETQLFIRPGFDWQYCDVLMTNFHQPQSTLLALVASFAGLERMRKGYNWAIENQFRLFSYGDLSVWIKRR